MWSIRIPYLKTIKLFSVKKPEGSKISGRRQSCLLSSLLGHLSTAVPRTSSIWELPALGSGFYLWFSWGRGGKKGMDMMKNFPGHSQQVRSWAVFNLCAWALKWTFMPGTGLSYVHCLWSCINLLRKQFSLIFFRDFIVFASKPELLASYWGVLCTWKYIESEVACMTHIPFWLLFLVFVFSVVFFQSVWF